MKIEPLKLNKNITLRFDESISDKISWTAEMPKGELKKLKMVCKPIATEGDVVIWVIDPKKVSFI